MKILHCSDLHLNHDWFDWVASHAAEYDLLVIAGDLQNAFSNNSMHDQARACTKWLLSLKTSTVVCTGNHDWWGSDPRFYDASAEGRWLRPARANSNVVGVDGEVVELCGLKIAVNGWRQVPELDGRIDIVVSHAPPTGCACATGAEGHDNGDPTLWPALRNNPPRMILAGHIHSPNQFACTWPPINPTNTVFVPGCDEDSKIPNYWVIDTESGTARHSGGEIVRLLLKKT